MCIRDSRAVLPLDGGFLQAGDGRVDIQHTAGPQAAVGLGDEGGIDARLHALDVYKRQGGGAAVVGVILIDGGNGVGAGVFGFRDGRTVLCVSCV